MKKTTMDTYFDAGHITSYVQQKTEMILSALQLGNYRVIGGIVHVGNYNVCNHPL